MIARAGHGALWNAFYWQKFWPKMVPHTKPGQQGCSILQSCPGIEQRPWPHTPLLHVIEQHSAAVMHAAPSGEQACCWLQTPLTHSAEQHSAAVMQGAPLGEQAGPEHTPLTHEPLQH